MAFIPSRESEIFSFVIFATAEGYVEDKKTFTYTVATDGSGNGAFVLGVPDVNSNINYIIIHIS